MTRRRSCACFAARVVAGGRSEETEYPPGWDEARVRRVLEHYDAKSDDEALAEDEAAYESTTHTAMENPG